MATGWTAGVQFPVRTRTISLFHSVETGSGAQPASCPTGTDTLSLGIKRPGCEADHLPLSSAEVENVGAVAPLPHATSYRGA
jgi:hypothetical protein